MLVLTRRENDRIIFPALGISVEVMKLGRGRASIGIVAPKGIRVMRHELLADKEPLPSGDGLVEAVRQQVASHIQDEVDAAAHTLQLAQEDLAAGRTEEGLAGLAQALAELDQLRCKTQDDEAIGPEPFGFDDELNKRGTDQWEVAGTVAEPTTGYATSAAGDCEQRSQQVLFVDSSGDQDHELASDLAPLGFHVDHAGDGLAVLYELSRQQKTDVVVLKTMEAEAQATVRLIRNCSRHPQVPIVFVEGSITTRIDASDAADQIRSAIAQQYAQQISMCES